MKSIESLTWFSKYHASQREIIELKEKLKTAVEALEVVECVYRNTKTIDPITFGIVQTLVDKLNGRWCDSMNRPKRECGCPDCGPALVDYKGEGEGEIK